MRPRTRRYARIAFLALAVVLLVGWLLPFFLSAERYRRRLEAGLAGALQRPVVFRAVSFHLLPRPGFSIENAVVREDPAFGSEPFARVDRIECDLHWRSLWRSRFDFSRLHLERASFNFVRNAQGEWNVESLLLKSGMAAPGVMAPAGEGVGDLNLEADDARVDFKVGVDKKPFTIVDLRARMIFDRTRRLLRFRLAGSPMRTDLSLPSPGVMELDGEWTPGRNHEGPLNATLRTRGALLYNWVPLVTGHNPEIYGVLDADVHLTGSLRAIQVEGQSRLSDLHRWERIPPSEAMPWTLYFRGEFDRTRGRALLKSLDASFGDSHLHVTGSVDRIPAPSDLDLVVALERSRLEDFVALMRRLGAPPLFGVFPGAWTAC